MTEKPFAKEQVQRFAGLDKFPHGQREAVEELIYAVQSFDTQEQAKKYVNDWLARERECPKPADIRRTAWALEEQAEAERREGWVDPTDLCRECEPWGAYGWIMRDGRYERCGGAHGSDVSQILLDSLNEQERRKNTDEGLRRANQAKVAEVLAGRHVTGDRL